MKAREELNDVQVIERYLILLLGVVDKPVPSILHLEKELFILSKANPTIANFITFEKHYYGPYSEDIAELVRNPVYYVDVYKHEPGGAITLNQKGKKIYQNLVKEHSKNPRFKELLGMMKMIREMYDKLSKDELLFLIYATYNEYTQKSTISDKLLSPQKRREIAEKLLRKGIITPQRYSELVSDNE
ncbi:MAG: hypothetical protein Q6352_011910 [Candidatus Freyrarchaeum guaymaensis]